MKKVPGHLSHIHYVLSKPCEISDCAIFFSMKWSLPENNFFLNYHRFQVFIHTLIIIMYVIHLPSQTRMMNQRNLIEKSPSSQIYSSSMDCALRVRADCEIIYIHGTCRLNFHWIRWYPLPGINNSDELCNAVFHLMFIDKTT